MSGPASKPRRRAPDTGGREPTSWSPMAEISLLCGCTLAVGPTMQLSTDFAGNANQEQPVGDAAPQPRTETLRMDCTSLR